MCALPPRWHRHAQDAPHGGRPPPPVPQLLLQPVRTTFPIAGQAVAAQCSCQQTRPLQACLHKECRSRSALCWRTAGRTTWRPGSRTVQAGAGPRCAPTPSVATPAAPSWWAGRGHELALRAWHGYLACPMHIGAQRREGGSGPSASRLPGQFPLATCSLPGAHAATLCRTWWCRLESMVPSARRQAPPSGVWRYLQDLAGTMPLLLRAVISSLA